MRGAYQVRRDAMLVRDFSAKLNGANIHRGSATLAAYGHAIQSALRAIALIRKCEKEMR
jgi:hypothetical protein